MNSAGSKKPQLSGTKDLTPLFSSKLLVHMNDVFCSSLSGPRLMNYTHITLDMIE